jgi:hypothetical protein
MPEKEYLAFIENPPIKLIQAIKGRQLIIIGGFTFIGLCSYAVPKPLADIGIN